MTAAAGPVAVLGEMRELVSEQGRVRVGERGRAHEDAVRASGGAGAAERAGVVRVVDPQWYRAGVEAEVRGQPPDHEPGRGQIPGLPAGTRRPARGGAAADGLAAVGAVDVRPLAGAATGADGSGT